MDNKEEGKETRKYEDEETPNESESNNDELILYMEDLGDKTITQPSTHEEGENNNEIPTFGNRNAESLLETDNTHKRMFGSVPNLTLELRGNSRRNSIGLRSQLSGNEGIDDGFLTERMGNADDEYPATPTFRQGSPFPMSPSWVQVSPDMNVYQQKKTIAQGMMDLALLSANANQMRYVLQSSGHHPYFYPSLIMIGMSLILQVVVGIGLIWNSRYDVKLLDERWKANRANNLTVIAIFLVTILNVFISSFGVVEPFTLEASSV